MAARVKRVAKLVVLAGGCIACSGATFDEQTGKDYGVEDFMWSDEVSVRDKETLLTLRTFAPGYPSRRYPPGMGPGSFWFVGFEIYLRDVRTCSLELIDLRDSSSALVLWRGAMGSKKSRFVLAVEGINSNGPKITVSEVATDGNITVISESALPHTAMPTIFESESLWVAPNRLMRMYLLSENVTLHCKSWNGEGTAALAEARFTTRAPNELGTHFIRSLPGDIQWLENVPLAEWPEPVWLFRLCFT